jgi:hypothetical protein
LNALAEAEKCLAKSEDYDASRLKDVIKSKLHLVTLFVQARTHNQAQRWEECDKICHILIDEQEVDVKVLCGRVMLRLTDATSRMLSELGTFMR